MTLTPAFLLDGEPLPRLIPYPRDAQDLSVEQLSDRAVGLARAAAVTRACAELEAHLDEAAANPAAARALVAEIRAQAEAGHSAAAHVMGRLLLEGWQEVPKDETQALAWLTRAARQGFAQSQTLVGFHHRVTAREPARALPFLHAAAEQGDARAQVLMADSLDAGVQGVLDADPQEALRQLRRAAEAETAEPFYRGLAAAILADKLSAGEGVDADPEEAIRWNRHALACGYTGNRVELLLQLQAANPAAHAQEIAALLEAALAAGDPRAQALASAAAWQRELGTFQHGNLSLDLWTRRLVYTGGDPPFSDRHGRPVPIAPAAAGRALGLSEGEEVIALYAGPSRSDGNATGFPYRLYKSGTSEVADVQPLDGLVSELAPRRLTVAAVVAVGAGLVLTAIGGATAWLAVPVVAAGAVGWAMGRLRVRSARRALQVRLDRIGQWMAAGETR